MGRKLIDIVGQKFGKLTVESLCDKKFFTNDGKEKVQWNCKCDCGNTITVTGDYLRKPNFTPSCGCSKYAESLVGKVFGMLTVESEYTKTGKLREICKCECGGTIDIGKYNLLSGKTTNCGCIPSIKIGKRKDISGNKYNMLTVLHHDENIYYSSGGNRIYKVVCQCDCGNIVSIERQKLINGHTKSCGCLAGKRIGVSREEYWDKYKNLKDGSGKLKDLTGMRFGKLIVNKYAGNRKWECTCDCGSVVLVNGSNLSNGHTSSCGCIDSVGEFTIAKTLSDNNITFSKEYTFEKCKDKHRLPFDFCVFDNNEEILCLIEFDGIQHYQAVRFNGMTDESAQESFLTCQYHDKLKNSFCAVNGIPLLRIKYDQLDDVNDVVLNFVNKCRGDRYVQCG
jgi:hypothetical protein